MNLGILVMSNFFSPIVCNELSFANQKVRTELAAVYLCCRMTEDADQIESVLYMARQLTALVFFKCHFRLDIIHLPFRKCNGPTGC
jgi:hypothetical protein